MDIDRMIKELGPGSEISTVMLLREKTLAVSRAGKKYLTLTFGDRSGQIEGKLWDEAELVDQQLSRMSPVKVEGVLSMFRDTPQVTVRSVEPRPWTDDMYDLLLPVSPQSGKELRQRLDRLLGSLSNPHVSALARSIVEDKELFQRFLSVPAAKIMHHAYIRGLLEHTVSMMEIASFLHGHYDRQYPGVLDRDVLLMGTLLHDLGKVTEYTFERGIDITTEGRLVGHLVLGIEVLNGKLAGLPDFPEELALRIKHLVVSHHGDFEKGAPVRPITAEALLLHFIDFTDSQFNAMLGLVNRAGTEEFSAYSNKFERRFLNPHMNAAAPAEHAPATGDSPADEPEPPAEPERGRKREAGKREGAPATVAPTAPAREEEMPEWLRDDPGGAAWDEPLPENGSASSRSSSAESEGDEHRDKKKKKTPPSPSLF